MLLALDETGGPAPDRRVVAGRVGTSESTVQALTALSEAHRVSKQTILREAVLEKAEREGRAQLVRAHALEVASRRRALLDRLGEA